MLVINGANDVHVPQHDTLVFQGRRDTVVDLIPDAGHCAPTKLPYVMATIADWLTRPVDSPLGTACLGHQHDLADVLTRREDAMGLAGISEWHRRVDDRLGRASRPSLVTAARSTVCSVPRSSHNASMFSPITALDCWS